MRSICRKGRARVPKQSNQKSKLLYLWKILCENTDEEHALTMQQILSMLETYDVHAERKSVYDDLQTLEWFYDAEILRTEERSVGYYLTGRTFDVAELKLLVDAVQSSKFITTKKSMELIRKIESLCSRYEAVQLQRQVFVQNRIKTMNESIYYNVDKLHDAISGNRQIAFRYFQWNVQGEKELRRNGEEYIVSPWALSWDDENYYMVAYDAMEQGIRHYRVDKMLRIRLLDKAREGEKLFDKFDTAVYSKKIFGMFGGEEKNVTLRCENRLAGVVIDRFGKDAARLPEEDGAHFTVTVRIFESPNFLSWVMGFGDAMEVLSPASTRDALCAQAQAVLSRYAQIDHLE